MPIALDLLVALAAAALAFAAARAYGRSPVAPARPSLEPAVAVGEAARSHGRARRLLASRFDRSVATGFLLTVALLAALAGGVVLGVLAYLVRSVAALQHVDNAVADWGFRHRTGFSTDALHGVTDLGRLEVVVVLAVLVVVVDFVRTRSRWCLPYLVVVMGGAELLMHGVKDLAGRVRPALDPIAATLGPSFPSGHSSTAASFYAAAALVLGRHARPWLRHSLAGLAVGIAVAVAGSRVLLDLHWLSDVLGGLALGWGWFALCSAVFGGRLLRPTAAVDTAARAATRRAAPG